MLLGLGISLMLLFCIAMILLVIRTGKNKAACTKIKELDEQEAYLSLWNKNHKKH